MCRTSKHIAAVCLSQLDHARAERDGNDNSLPRNRIANEIMVTRRVFVGVFGMANSIGALRRSILQKFLKPKDMAALPSKAKIGGVTDAQAPEPIAQGCEPAKPLRSRLSA
jgi:hypothetical protein